MMYMQIILLDFMFRLRIENLYAICEVGSPTQKRDFVQYAKLINETLHPKLQKCIP